MCDAVQVSVDMIMCIHPKVYTSVQNFFVMQCICFLTICRFQEVHYDGDDDDDDND